MARQLENWIDSYLKFTRNSESPAMFHTWTAISVLAAAMQRKCHLQYGMLSLYPNMYIVLVAPSGKARKGMAMSIGYDFLDELGIPLAAEATTREALIQSLQASNTTSVTPDGTFIFHSSLTIFSQELAVFLGFKNLTLLSDLTDWFDCRKRWTYKTKHFGVDDIERVWVNLLGATTPELIQTTLPSEAIGGGLTSRMIFVYEPRKGKTVCAPFLTDDDKDLRNTLMQDLYEIHQVGGEFKVTKDFVELWSIWYPEQDENPPFKDPRFAGYLSRRPTHAMKLSMILSMARSSDMILTGEFLQEAITLLERTEKKMPFALGGVGRSQHSGIMADIMYYIGAHREVFESELQAAFHTDADASLLDVIIRTLVRMNFCTIKSTNKGTLIVYNEGYKNA